MIESIRIENFKCFESFAVDELRRITLIGGKNNVGKTALLEAFWLFLANLSEQRVFGQYARRGLRRIDHRADIAWAPMFRDYDLAREIMISLKGVSGPEELRIKLVKAHTLPKFPCVPDEKAGALDTDEPAGPSEALEFRNNQGQKLWLTVDPKSSTTHMMHGGSGEITPVAYVGTRSHPAEQGTRIFDELDKAGEAARVIRFLQLIEPGLDELTLNLVAGEPVVHGRLHHERRKNPVVFMGEGVVRLLTIMLAMVEARNGVVLIDEVENGIHYSVQTTIWKAIAQAATELSCQVFATTHSYEFVRHAQEALADDYADDFRYIRLDRTDKGIEARSYDIEILETAISAGMEVR